MSGGCEFRHGAPQPESMIGDRSQRRELQLLLIRRDEQLDAAADASLFGDALGELLVEVFLEIAERVEVVRIFGKTRPVEVVFVDEPNENRLAAFTIPQDEEGEWLRRRF